MTPLKEERKGGCERKSVKLKYNPEKVSAWTCGVLEQRLPSRDPYWKNWLELSVSPPDSQ